VMASSREMTGHEEQVRKTWGPNRGGAGDKKGCAASFNDGPYVRNT